MKTEYSWEPNCHKKPCYYLQARMHEHFYQLKTKHCLSANFRWLSEIMRDSSPRKRRYSHLWSVRHMQSQRRSFPKMCKLLARNCPNWCAPATAFQSSDLCTTYCKYTMPFTCTPCQFSALKHAHQLARARIHSSIWLQQKTTKPGSFGLYGNSSAHTRLASRISAARCVDRLQTAPNTLRVNSQDSDVLNWTWLLGRGEITLFFFRKTQNG